MKKIIIGLLSLLILIIAVFSFLRSDHLSEDIALKNTIIETVENSSEVDFSTITDFDFDKMYILHPYTPVNRVLEEEGIKPSNDHFNIELFDDINMLAFVKGDTLVAFVELPRDICKAQFDKNIMKFNKEETKFNILQEEKTIVFE
ncbi:hypothetical protein [Crassaminicella profunda]|uniref:hypothetical protein n=1 Tax=Crassaminicella profunda TaxID=1286698 RepID=UPI001CA63329|nr:hypothetical protein [Crassaminicella profunda]QZY55969.1 hypothetical protein K7H06_02825 [Crassaminicella profunda]